MTRRLFKTEIKIHAHNLTPLHRRPPQQNGIVRDGIQWETFADVFGISRFLSPGDRKKSTSSTCDHLPAGGGTCWSCYVHGAAESRRSRRYWGQGGVLGVL